MNTDPRGTGTRDLAMTGPAKPTDRSSIRRTNLGMVLRLLRDSGARSRARIATETGLPKATVSSLIGELVELGLVREGTVERDGAVGRPGHAVEVDGRSVCGIGVEINVDYLSVIALDLRGDVAAERRIAVDVRAAEPEAVLDSAAQLVRETIDALLARGIRTVGVTLAAPGVIDMKREVVSYAANIGWREVAVSAGLRARLGRSAPPIHLENDAKLGAIAEYLVASASDIHELLYLTGETGVGAGIIANGRLLRGIAGFAGEVGHMPMDPSGQLCSCGRRGCWETMVGLAALLRFAAEPDDPVCDPSVDLERRLTELLRRAAAGDARTLTALDRIAAGLGPGVALLVDLLNPRLVVLGGHFAHFGDYLIDTVTREVHERVMASDAGGCEIVLSTLGFTAAARGGALLALDAVYADPSGI
ncbi:ROK family protein [Streptacidiphilus sp. EB129]|uniref:ROK family transcriptional regulator n=1 Tax=Streptacidiphilus sp. EB129 TaxID=3156262 RepID=UPI0035162BB5